MNAPSVTDAITILYVAGVVWALVRSDAPPAARIALSLLWPLGPLAFLVTVAVLLAASVIAYPRVMIPTVGGAVAIVWWATR